MSLNGVPMPSPGALSSFADHMLVHEHAVVKIREDMPLDRAALIGPDLQVVLDDRHLAIKGEAETRVTLGSRDDVVHQVDQPQPEPLERFVPFAIPVGVRYQEDVVAHELAASPPRSRRLRARYADVLPCQGKCIQRLS